MTWDFYDDGREIKIEKAKKSETILNSLDPKQKKALKKTLQAAEPTEFFGQDFTKLGELLRMIEDLDFTKADKKLTKKVKSMDERNLDIVATATKLRKEYELLYRQIRDLIYPQPKRKKGD
jgi:nicotinic acid phosphoribosyltransferase